MYKKDFYPLRTIVGSSIPIKSIFPQSVSPPNFRMVTIPNTQPGGVAQQIIQDTVDIQLPDIGSVYEKFLPSIMKDTSRYLPLPGMATMPVPDSTIPGAAFPVLDFLNSPSDLPFSPTDTVGSIFGFQTAGFKKLDINLNADNEIAQHAFLSNTDRDFTFKIELTDRALIGGICFSGYPYITSRIEAKTGMCLGNFGLPREIRLTPLPAIDKSGNIADGDSGFRRSQFIDSEFTYTRQEMISHSGLNYVCFDPVKTNHFYLTITDLPFIMKEIDLDKSSVDENGLIKINVAGFKGFAIPYLYFFEYKESTHRNARLHGGVLGLKSEVIPKPDGKHPDLMRLAFPEYEVYTPLGEKRYALFTAHSAFGQRRRFGPSNKARNFNELFISDLLQKDERVTIFLQQGEEYDRCVAGLRMLFPMFPDDLNTQKLVERLVLALGGNAVIDNILSDEERKSAEEILATFLEIPKEINFCEQIRIRIFELDPVEGLSPAEIVFDDPSHPTAKYATLVADTEINDFLDVFSNYFLKGLLFRTTSSSRYFAIELTNTGDKEGQIVIHSMHLVRSAHASVQPRAARTQRVKAMHYRLIGADLADDFSKLGNEGFNFSIDRVTAGQTKDVLYSAMSLLDLLHTGNARIQSNVRRRSIEEEIVRTAGGSANNFEIRETESRLYGWRRSESGPTVSGDATWQGENSPYVDGKDFNVFGNQEIRTHNSYLYPRRQKAFWNAAATYGNALDAALHLGTAIGAIIEGDQSDLLVPTFEENQLMTGFEDVWTGIAVPDISGLININQSPFGLIGLTGEALDALVGSLSGIMTILQDVSSGNMDPLILADTLARLANVGQFLAAINPLSPLPNPLAVSLLNGLSIVGQIQPVGLGATITATPASCMPQIMGAASYGSTGNISLQANSSKYSFSQYLNKSFDEGAHTSRVTKGSSDRVVERKAVKGTDNKRIKGAEVMWQGKLQDIITGSIPLNFTLPATATKMNFRTADETLRVRFNSGFSSSIEVDFWFELIEETIRDDN